MEFIVFLIIFGELLVDLILILLVIVEFEILFFVFFKLGEFEGGGFVGVDGWVKGFEVFFIKFVMLWLFI